MVRIIREKDKSYTGLFVVGVKSTGVFCRPGCPARTPQPEQMEFFASAGEARRAGYRPCKRCRPDTTTNPPPLVAKLEALLREDPAQRITSWDLRELGIDPSTARRQFQRHFGLSFAGYQRARRLGLALHDLRNGKNIMDASYDTGYESISGFSEAISQLFGAPPSKAVGQKCLTARLYESPLGAMIALANDTGIHLLEFVDRRMLPTEIEQIRKLLECVIVPGSNAVLEELISELDSYFNGTLTRFETPCHISGTLFEQAVWQQLQKIPYGKTASYGDIARNLGRSKAVRAVGRANGANKLAIIIPCHRVIRADGTLCGYGGGVWRKKWLIEHERENLK